MRKFVIASGLGLLAVAAILATNWQELGEPASQEIALWTGSAPESEFAEPGSVPIGGAFEMVDHTGRTVTDDDFRGSYLLVFFGFANCPDVCPTSLAEMSRALDLLGDQVSAVQPLFVSVDPERDTPEVMAQFVQAFDPRIVGLTGTEEQVADMKEAYRVYSEKVPAEGQSSQDYTVSHQAQIYLMSTEGEYLTHFAYGTAPDEMAETVLRAIAEFGAPEKEGT